jgi:hypothetical protein
MEACGMISKQALVVLGLLMPVVGGCHRPQQDRAETVRVMVEGGGAFPNSLAGRWRARQHGWEFQIEPDGRISSATLSLGRVHVVPGQTTTMPTKSGHQAVFTPGLWTVHYAPDTRELTIRVTMKHVRVEMAGNIWRVRAPTPLSALSHPQTTFGKHNGRPSRSTSPTPRIMPPPICRQTQPTEKRNHWSSRGR